MRAITKMVSGQPYRVDGYEEYILSAVSGAAFTATLEGQVQTNVEGITQSLEWVTLASLNDGVPQNYDTQTPFIRVNVTSGTPTFHLQRLERATNRSQDLSRLRSRLDIISLQTLIGRIADYNYTTLALFAAAPIINGKFSYVLETAEYFEAVAGVQVSRGTLIMSGLTDTQLRATPIPVSNASLPLPAGASTQTTLAAVLAALHGALTVTTPSQLSIKSQTSLAATGASQSLPSAPAGTTYALIQIKAQTLWFRLDAATAVSGGGVEQYVDPGGTLELTSAAEITGFRGIQVSGGVLGIVYRGA